MTLLRLPDFLSGKVKEWGCREILVPSWVEMLTEFYLEGQCQWVCS